MGIGSYAGHVANGRGTPRVKRAIMLALTSGDSPALGNIWRITAKKSDFYLDSVGSAGDAMHVSLHGPRVDFTDHRFHVKIDRKAVNRARGSGNVVEHSVPRRGQTFRGLQVSEHVYRVVRLRWLWHVQRESYRDAAVFGTAPDLDEGVSGMRQRGVMKPNSAWDVDLYISYADPYWPIPLSRSHGDPRLGPLRNEAGHWLTGHSFVRSLMLDPSPVNLVPRLPDRTETPNRLTCGGLGPKGEDDMYWFAETITAREYLESVRSDQ